MGRGLKKINAVTWDSQIPVVNVIKKEKNSTPSKSKLACPKI
jgi:hypothetical protein